MHRLPILALLVASQTVALADTSLSGWYQWRGPNRDGVSPETGLLKEWPTDGPKQLWQVKGVGSGMGSVSIGGGKIFVLGKRKEGVCITALDAATQKEAWFALVSAKGDANGAPTFDGERVYAVSKDGQMLCCDAATGKELWHKDYATDFGGKMMSGWGYSESPLVDGDAVIVVPGANDAMMVALNKKTGDVLWKSALPADVGTRGKDGAGYTGAIISNGGGVKQYLTLAGRGLISVRASDGKTLWTYNAVANGTANIPTPLAWDDYVFTSSGYGTGAALLELKKDGDGVKADEKYFLKATEFQNHHGGMVRLGDYIYAGKGHNNGFPTCVEWKTGKIVWEQSERPGKESAAVIAADGELYFRWQDGIMGLIDATPAGYRLKGSFKLPVIQGQSWPHPAIHDKKLYVRVQDTLLCFDVAGEKKALP
jgi:outer membrane protein assembly factor BamB